jgi:hypothetical protein
MNLMALIGQQVALQILLEQQEVEQDQAQMMLYMLVVLMQQLLKLILLMLKLTMVLPGLKQQTYLETDNFKH